MDEGHAGHHHHTTASQQASATALRVDTEGLVGCQIVTADGQVDLTNAHNLHAALSLALHPARPLIADLTGIEFVDSRGLRALMANQRNAALKGARLLVVPSPSVAELLLLRPADGLETYPSLDEALAAARQPAADAV